MTKPKNKASYSTPTDENPEWTAETFARSRPIEDLLPPEIVAQFAKRGRPKSAVRKVPVSMRLSGEVVEKFKAIGPGWQTAIDDVLKIVKVTRTNTPAKGPKRYAFRAFKGRLADVELIVHGKDGRIAEGRKPHVAKKRA